MLPQPLVSDTPTPGIAAAPDSSFDFLFPAACQTLARCSPLRTSEAHDADGLGFIAKIRDIPAVLPPGQALIVVPSMVAPAHPIRIAHEEEPTESIICKPRHELSSVV